LATNHYKESKEFFFEGLSALDRLSKQLYQTSFAKTTFSNQSEVLQSLIKEKPTKRFSGKGFVEFALLLTLEGLLGDPIYGGNKNLVGWQMIGFEQHCRRPSVPYDG
jgi:gluconate 2-dehydrogenase gamma chain